MKNNAPARKPPATAARRRPQPGKTEAPGQETILVLQGGGALGAYQAGVCEVLQGHGYQPDWVAGISIGAINAALIAGNPPESRGDRLREFWQLVSSASLLPGPLPWPQFDAGVPLRDAINSAAAAQVMLNGVPGFFKPRLPPAVFQPRGTLEAISYYDTAPLRETLERLVDFDRLNDGPMRLSVGAVNVRSGNFEYFDTRHRRIDARHVMASGALPPGFAPVEIDGEHYWDGGLVSNTPLQYVLDNAAGPARRTVFQVDLFPARAELPACLSDVTTREKDIRFSSRTRLNTRYELERQATAQAAQRLLQKLPAELRNDPDALALARQGCDGPIDVVHLIYRSKRYETSNKDYEFSRLSMQEHWDAGHADMARTLDDQRWQAREPRSSGIRVFDLAADRPPAGDTIAHLPEAA